MAPFLEPHTNPHAWWIFLGFQDFMVRKYGLQGLLSSSTGNEGGKCALTGAATSRILDFKCIHTAAHWQGPPPSPLVDPGVDMATTARRGVKMNAWHCPYHSCTPTPKVSSQALSRAAYSPGYYILFGSHLGKRKTEKTPVCLWHRKVPEVTLCTCPGILH